MKHEDNTLAPTESRQEILADVVTQYFIEGLDQREIASNMGVSRSTISRFISEARELGIVEIRVNRPLPISEELQNEAISRFPISKALVLNADEISGDVLDRVGHLAARYLSHTLPPTGSIAMSWGTSLAATVSALPNDPSRDMRVIQMIGAAGSRQPEIDGAMLAQELAKKLGGQHISLNVPLIVDDAIVASALLRQASVATVLEEASQALIALIGLGSMASEASSLLRSGFASEHELDRVRGEGIVGDLGGHMLDAEGQICNTSLSRRMLRLDQDRLRDIPEVIAVASGATKVHIIRAAMLSGILDTIVTDSRTMARVLAEPGT